MAIAARRAQPIPVYAEMSSINPVFLMPRALATRAENLGSALVASLCMGVGQFCTSPGIVLGIDGSDFTRFLHAAAQAVTAQTSATMLTPIICDAYRVGVERLVAQPGVRVIGKGNDSGPGTGVPILLAPSSECLHENAQLREEVFGPVSILVACRDIDDMIEVAKRIEGQLTMTLQMDDDDISHARRFLPVLERKAGRVLVNGFPTGVEVADAMVHGGPYPATSDGRSTSVGTAAVERFLRPVCYQNFSSTLLPEALRDENPLGLTRRLDGKPA